MIINITDYEKPKNINFNADGFATETIINAEDGKSINIAVRGFVISYDKKFELIANEIARHINVSPHKVNKLLIAIKNDGSALVYEDFPIVMTTRVKKAVKLGGIVMDDNIFNIEEIRFETENFSFDFQKGDKLIWLFRDEWRFGIHFDFTKELSKEEIYKELGQSYNYLKYYSIYEFLSNEENYTNILSLGWFPFIELIPHKYKRLLNEYECDVFNEVCEDIIDEYNEDLISSLTEKWWRNELFFKKKEIIEAGIASFLQKSNVGYINCIKNLSSEIEGILRIDYINEKDKSPKFKDFPDYIEALGKEKFSNEISTSFVTVFSDYVDNVLFKSFDVQKGDVPLSRHSVSHGVADCQEYTKIKAFQHILTLDQIWYYMS